MRAYVRICGETSSANSAPKPPVVARRSAARFSRASAENSASRSVPAAPARPRRTSTPSRIRKPTAPTAPRLVDATSPGIPVSCRVAVRDRRQRPDPVIADRQQHRRDPQPIRLRFDERPGGGGGIGAHRAVIEQRRDALHGQPRHDHGGDREARERVPGRAPLHRAPRAREHDQHAREERVVDAGAGDQQRDRDRGDAAAAPEREASAATRPPPARARTGADRRPRPTAPAGWRAAPGRRPSR